MYLRKTLIIVFLILLADQISKIYVKTHFQLEESVEVFSWFRISFIENPGAAWGTKLSDILPISERTGKLLLTLFRLVAIGGIGYWLWDLIRKGANNYLRVAVSLIFAGAVGNIIDSLFYGLIFNHSVGQVATFMAEDNYGGLFYGKVVDMLYFPMVDTTWPDWVPGVGGNRFRFFAPVFNIADTAISTGVGILLVFNKRAFAKPDPAETQTETAMAQAQEAAPEGPESGEAAKPE
ncbi:signal peptidase II [Robiginitalea myxolifaciens]|uniref:Lipoprotein signal peptidase n=1 Tax=Robiginitalea myxolifaciens TaxID=400055 RepID=A0A1I6G6D9_9FLAO|nr:lipoprotein signal peptidase [Robiginitalea myxolifaciens]SFR37752.1 signal peptidase II [Robiginitalea myxolifaciens]